ncbi:tryptophan--tRNA ligase, mitochondrial isoform X2 [Amphiprion ocellaris]|uniref:tryptophan--tRNA ligase, mitochondrial isoform X2 n=1 Tax=Amphiprion ocellaris TaxID=80972 RepID=UPI002410C9B8|nr:tryptophan--tRNA ligase, mitochondrial isoform X2 [Amphiprion ocellaris]
MDFPTSKTKESKSTHLNKLFERFSDYFPDKQPEDDWVRDPFGINMESITLPSSDECQLVELSCDRTLRKKFTEVSEHAELSWILGCLTSMPRLRHLPQWKMKSKQKNEGSVGLYTYPVLQAADILLYKSTHVPVGEDQVQHLELAQDLARIFNHRFGDLFPEPRALLSSTRKIKSLREPSAKMSKSDPQTMATVFLTDSPDDVALKIRRSVTDFTSEVTFDPENRPGVSNLVSIHAAMATISVEEAVSQATGLDTGAYKQLVTEAVVQRLTPIRLQVERLRSDPAHLEHVLAQGASRARELAAPVLEEVKQRVGFC